MCITQLKLINAAPLCFQENVGLDARDAETAGKGNGEPRGRSRGVGHQSGCGGRAGRPLDLFITLTFVIVWGGTDGRLATRRDGAG